MTSLDSPKGPPHTTTKQRKSSKAHALANSVNVDQWMRLLDPSESQAVTKVFNAEEQNSRFRMGTIDFDQLHRVFLNMGASISKHFLEALASEVPNAATHSYTLADAHHIYASWKSVVQHHSSNSKTWARSAAVKRATTTKLMLIDTPLRTMWNVLFMTVSLIHFIVVMARDESEGMEREAKAGFVVLDVLFTMIYAANIALILNTALVTKQGVVDDKQVVRNTYLKTWMIPDVIAMIPLDVILSLSGASFGSALVSHLRIINTVRSLFIWGISGYIPITERYIKFYFQVLPLLRLFYGFIGTTVLFAGIFILVKRSAGSNLDELQEYHLITAWYFIIQTMTTVGYGDITISTSSELWYTICVLFFGLIMNGLIIGRLVMLLQLVDAGSLRQDKLRETLAVLQYFEIPQQLQIEILNFQSHVLWSSVNTAFNHVTYTLPPQMKENVLLLQRVETIRQVPQLANASEVVVTCLARELKEETRKPEEYVSIAGEPHKGFRFLIFGFVDKNDAKGRYLATLKTGDSFGLEGLLELKDEEFNFKALSYCDLLVLPAEQFHVILQRFPVFAQQLRTDEKQLPNMLVEGNNFAFSSVQKESTNVQTRRAQHIQMLQIKLRAFKEKLITIRDKQDEAISQHASYL